MTGGRDSNFHSTIRLQTVAHQQFFFSENKKVIDGIDKLQIRLVNGVSDIYGSS